MNKVAIVGSNGFIGKFLVKNLQQNNQIISISRQFDELQNSQNIIPLTFDISSKWDFEEEINIVIFCATQHFLSRKTPNPYNFINSNITGLLNALEFSKNNQANLFIYLSTMSIYGKIQINTIDENTEINNPDIYGTSKYMGEKLVQMYSDHFDTLILRLPGVIGSIWDKGMPWINTAILKLKNNQDLTYYNGSSLFNNIVDLENILKFIMFYINFKDKQTNQILNLSATEPLKIFELINYISKILNSKSKIVEKKTEDVSFKISNKLLMKKFNFKTDTTKEIICNYLANTFI